MDDRYLTFTKCGWKA